MRNTNLVTISLPPALEHESEKIARKQHMTRSELMRTALRRYIEEQQMEEAIKIFEKERREGKLKVLPKGGLAKLIKGK